MHSIQWHCGNLATPPDTVFNPQAVYTALKETEQRATDLLPLWKVSAACPSCALKHDCLTNCLI